MRKCLPRFLVTSGFLAIFAGLVLMWFGFKSEGETFVSSTPPIATQSASLPDGQATEGIEGERVQVTEVVDGDTIKAGGNTIRLVGIDTPETVDPRRPVGCFGKEASNETKGLLTGKVVILQKDVSDKDKYGRLLRLIYLPLDNGQILFVNDYLVRAGFAKLYTYPPDLKFNEEFKNAEKEAKDHKKGLWGKCDKLN